MYKLGLKLWSINTDIYYNEAKKLYAQNLFDYIELYVIPNSTQTIKQWQDIHIPFIIHCAHSAHGFNLAKKEQEKSNLQIYNETKEFADALNAKYIIFHGGTDGDIKETAKQLKKFNEKRAVIENKPYLPIPNKINAKICRGYNFDEIKFVMDEAGCGFCLDFGHAICAANAFEKEPYSFIDEFINLKPNMFHLTDNDNINSPYDSHLHLGDGELNLDKIKAVLPKDAIITLETNKNSKENLDDFIGDAKCMRN